MEEDMILPDDFESIPADESMPEAEIEPASDLDTEQVDEHTSEPTEPEQDAQEPTTEDPQTPQMVKVKFDREEREIPLEEAVVLAQKGMNYERAVERARQEARDAWVAEQGYTWNGKPVTTEAEYKQAIMEKEIYDKYAGQVPDEIMDEIIASRRDREERAQEKAEREKQEQRDKDFADFFAYFQAVNDRAFDPAKDTIPAEVKEAFEKGQPLKVAYMEYHNKELRNQLKIAKKNAENLQKAPVGSVTANGGTKTEPVDPFMEGFNSID